MNANINIITKLNGNTLHVEAIITPAECCSSNGIFTYRLRNETSIIEEISNVTENKWDFSLPAHGQYFVQVSYHSKTTQLYKSSKLILFSQFYLSEYNDFLNTTDNSTHDTLSYFEPDYPYQDFCLFRLSDNDNNSDAIDGLMKERNMHSHTYSFNSKSICRLLTSHPVQKIQDKTVAFSGVTRIADRLIVGDNDLAENNINPEQIRNEIGDFWMIYQQEENVYILHDYLGLSKFYYYQNGDDFVVSNRYHLLLLGLKAVNINPKPYIDRIIADLSSTTAFARLNYSRYMLMENTYVLTSDKDLIISSNGVNFEDNELHQELFNPEPYDEKSYEALLQTGAEEMLDNMKIALEYPNADKFKIDLSGGLDSRMIYALITNFPKYRSKVYIHTLDLPYAPKDLPIALEMNSIYGYPYCTIGINSRPVSKRKTYQKLMSAYFCTNQQNMPVATETSFKEKFLDMPGLLGEMIFRPHMYTKFKAKPEEDNISPAEFIENRIYYNIESISEKGHEYFTDLFIKELNMMPGDTPVQKFQNHYTIFMDTIHHATYYPASINHFYQWTPLMSKTIFHLNNVTGTVFRSNKLAHDLVREINPALAAITYEKPLYNNELQVLAETDPYYAHTFSVAQECIDAQRKKWKEAQKIKSENATFEKLDADELAQIQKENINFFEDLKNDALYALRKIVKYNSKINETVGLDCFSRIYGNEDLPKNESFIKFLYNKIMTVYYALRIFDYVD